MNKKHFLLMIAVLVFATSGAALASWSPTTLEAVGYPLGIVVTPSWTQVGSDYVYSYELFNPTADDFVVGFTLALPTNVPVTSFTSVTAPTGWNYVLRTISGNNKINWRLVGDEIEGLGPQATKTFTFISQFAPSDTKNVFASCQDSYGYSGSVYGPTAVPEPGSLVALFTGLFGLAAFRRRGK